MKGFLEEGRFKVIKVKGVGFPLGVVAPYVIVFSKKILNNFQIKTT